MRSSVVIRTKIQWCPIWECFMCNAVQRWPMVQRTYVCKMCCIRRSEIKIFEIVVFGGLTIVVVVFFSDLEPNFYFNCIKFVQFNDNNLDVYRNSSSFTIWYKSFANLPNMWSTNVTMPDTRSIMLSVFIGLQIVNCKRYRILKTYELSNNVDRI